MPPTTTQGASPYGEKALDISSLGPTTAGTVSTGISAHSSSSGSGWRKCSARPIPSPGRQPATRAHPRHHPCHLAPLEGFRDQARVSERFELMATLVHAVGTSSRSLTQTSRLRVADARELARSLVTTGVQALRSHLIW